MTTMFNRLGLMIPVILSAFLFDEIPSPIKITGLIIAAVAIIINGKDGGKETGTGSLFSLAMVFLVGGLIDLNTKIFNYYGQSEMQERYVFYTFCFSLVLSLILMLAKNAAVTKRDVISGIMVGIPNQLVSLTLLKAAGILPAYLIFPINSAAVILVVNIVNFTVYHEKLTKRQYFCTGLICIALCLLNL